MASPLYIGVDGGGTSTTVVALDKSCQLICTTTSGSTNHNSVGKAMAKQHLHAGIRDAINTCGGSLSSVMSVCLGVSGCNNIDDADMLISWVKEMFPDWSDNEIPVITSYNDSIAALASGTNGELHGIVIIAGTGQMGKGRNKHNEKYNNNGMKRSQASPGTSQGGEHPIEWTCGGNGGLVDDGSGFGIALDGIRACFQCADGMGPFTSMLDTVLHRISARDETAIVPWLYNTFSWGHVASLAPIVFEHAQSETPDPVALAIIHKHSKYLINAVVTIHRKLCFPRDEPVTVVLAGGILAQSLMKKLVSIAVQQEIPNALITTPQVDPAHGAALLAVKQAAHKG